MKDVKRNDIYYADLNPIKGSEQGGIRPVLILQNDIGNRFSPTTIIAAITSQKAKAKLPTHVEIQIAGLPKDSIVLLEQIRTIDKTRLFTYVGNIGTEIAEEINKALAISLAL